MSNRALKKTLYEACVEHINKRVDTITRRLREVEESRNNETKSSVGDKYETGRSMMQMEEEKSKVQLHEALLVKSRLSQWQADTTYEHVAWGSLVFSSRGKYFLSIGLGKVILDGVVYYCVSSESPIGKLLLNKKKGDHVIFNNDSILIENIY